MSTKVKDSNGQETLPRPEETAAAPATVQEEAPKKEEAEAPAQTTMPEEAATAQAARKGQQPDSEDPTINAFVRILSVLVYVGIGLAVVWNTEAGHKVLNSEWWVMPAVVGVIILVALLPWSRRWFTQATAQRRIGVIIFGVIPAVLVIICAVILLPADWQAMALRTTFLVIVSSLPAVMYYLFIATKKYSLLNEFVINLDRLGLRNPKRLPPALRPPGVEYETEKERKTRILTYIQKFEAVYGAIPTDLGGMVLEPTDTSQVYFDQRMSNTNSSGLANIFTLDTTVPVVLATVLVALGWLLTLPPWQGQFVFKRDTDPTAGAAPARPDAARQDSAANAAPAQLAQVQAPVSETAAGERAADAAAGPSASSAGGAGSAVPNDWPDKWKKIFEPMGTPVHFAFIGAYFFSLQLLFRRYVRRDLRASAYVSVSLRIVLAVIGTWVVVAALALWRSLEWPPFKGMTDETFAGALLVTGFVIGVFPRVAWQILQSVTKRLGAYLLPSLQTQLPLSDLDGLTVWHEARLEEEDVENIPNMATADIIDLMINTRFPPDRIVDWVDQAILFTHLGPRRRKNGAEDPRDVLRTHGIRTATSLVETYACSKKEPEDKAAFEQLVPGEGRKPIRSLADAIETNPNIKLIRTWRGLGLQGQPATAGPTPEASG